MVVNDQCYLRDPKTGSLHLIGKTPSAMRLMQRPTITPSGDGRNVNLIAATVNAAGPLQSDMRITCTKEVNPLFTDPTSGPERESPITPDPTIMLIDSPGRSSPDD